jgi:hypothetical protein
MQTKESTPVRLGISSQQEKTVREVLREILSDALFSKSRRYTGLLEHVVLNTLAGNVAALKERSVGTEVFGRAEDYDMANDPVVRTAAVEVRKRLAQYFSTHPECPVRIELPPGGYAAVFQFPARSEPHEIVSPLGKPFEVVPPRLESAAVSAESASRARLSRSAWVYSIAAVALIAVAGIGYWNYYQSQSKRDFWEPVLKKDQPTVIVVGKTDMPSTGQQHLQPWTVGRTYLALDDVMTVAQMCSVLRDHRDDCNFASASASTLESLRGKSLILIGAFNNEWTLRLLAPYRYQIQMNPSNTDPQRVRTIVDHRSSGDTQLAGMGEDQSVELGRDYAVIARFHSDITESMVVVIAGLGPEGTDGARQFMASSANLKQILSRAPRDWDGVNLEAVLQVDIVHGSPSHEEVVATNFW